MRWPVAAPPAWPLCRCRRRRRPRWGRALASWQTVGGCGAGASTGNAAGVKWIGRSVTGGLFGVQCQVTYTRLGPRRPSGPSTTPS